MIILAAVMWTSSNVDSTSWQFPWQYPYILKLVLYNRLCTFSYYALCVCRFQHVSDWKLHPECKLHNCCCFLSQYDEKYNIHRARRVELYSIEFFINFQLCSLSVQFYIILKNIGGLLTGENLNILCTCIHLKIINLYFVDNFFISLLR